MNFQDILKPVETFLVWTFDNVMVPIGNGFNVVVAVGIVVGIAIWIRMQSKYDAVAERNNTLK